MLVLGSTSPRRRQLLDWLGIPYVIEAPDLDERWQPSESAEAMVRRLGRAKAAAVATRRSTAWVLAADTVVDLDGALLGKPADAAAARDMLARLAGREHRVSTGFALLAPGGVLQAEQVVVTRVRFRPLDPRAVAAYVASGEADDKAGGYAIQGLGAGLIDTIDGSVTNVMGLPLVEVTRALAEAGLLVR